MRGGQHFSNNSKISEMSELGLCVCVCVCHPSLLYICVCWPVSGHTPYISVCVWQQTHTWWGWSVDRTGFYIQIIIQEAVHCIFSWGSRAQHLTLCVWCVVCGGVPWMNAMFRSVRKERQLYSHNQCVQYMCTHSRGNNKVMNRAEFWHEYRRCIVPRLWPYRGRHFFLFLSSYKNVFVC